jgi:hypothetical protein
MKKPLSFPLMLVLATTLIFGDCTAVTTPTTVTETGNKSFEPETPFADGAPLVSNVNPVLVLSGSDYDIGYQYAHQLNRIFGPWALEELQRDFTREEVAALKAYQWQLEKYAPEYIEQFKGMVAGAADVGVELSYEEVLADHCGHTLKSDLATFPGTEPAESRDDKLPPHGCSGFAAWGSATKDGRLIAASSEDRPFRYGFVGIVFPETGNNYIFSLVILPPMGAHPGMNNKGLTYVHHGAGTNGNEAPGYGVPQSLVVQHTLRFADNAEEALQMQLAYPSGIRAAGLWADVSGNAFDLECRDPKVVRRAGDHGEEDFLYATNNCLTESLEPFLGGGGGHSLGWPLNYFEHGGWNMDDMNSVRRNLCIWNHLHNYHGLVNLEFVKMMWRMLSPVPDYPTLEEAEIQLNETHGEGWDTYIGSLGNGLVGIVQPDKGDKGLFYVCTGPAGRQTEPLTQEYYYFPIAPTYTFYELQLAADPAAVVTAAKKRSQYDLYYANKELRKLTYSDAAYAPLDKIFNEAATESQVGDYYLGLARSTRGNDSITNYAKALRAFTKCQAYAKQVYQTMGPPADDPTDLGLREWSGDWGVWKSAPDGDDDSGNP